MVYAFALFVFTFVPSTHGIRNRPDDVYHVVDGLSPEYRQSFEHEDIRKRREISGAEELLDNNGKPPKLSVQFDEQELRQDTFAKRRLEALKDMVSLRFRNRLQEDDEQGNKPVAFPPIDENKKSTTSEDDQTDDTDVSIYILPRGRYFVSRNLSIIQ